MSDLETVRGTHAPAGAAAARQALVEWVKAAGTPGRTFLQVHLRHEGGRFSVRHVDDRHRSPVDLRLYADPFAAREVAQTTEEGAHRPLKTAPTLRRGWRFEALDERGLWTVMDYLYPACVGHWHAGVTGSLRVTHWGETAARQSGIYSSVRLLSPPAVRDAVRACCGDAVCLRRVAWGLDQEQPDPLPANDDTVDSAATDAAIPCPEACSMFVSFARAVLKVERAPRSPVAGLGELNEGEMEQLRARVEAMDAVAQQFDDVRRGDQDDDWTQEAPTQREYVGGTIGVIVIVAIVEASREGRREECGQCRGCDDVTHEAIAKQLSCPLRTRLRWREV